MMALEHSLKHPSEQIGSAEEAKGATPKVMVQLHEGGWEEGERGERKWVI